MEMPHILEAPPVTLRAAPSEDWTGSIALGDRAEVLVAAPATAETRGVLARLADAGHPVRQVFDAHDAVELLSRADGPAIALVDEDIGALGGLEVIRRLRSRAGDRYVYTVLMVSHSGRAKKLAGREAGADDCITKPVNSRELQAYLRAGQRIASLEQRLVEARDRFRAQARRDPLTGLANRLDIMETLTREVSRSAREETPVAVVMVDLDHFKRINDTYGHQAGDDVIREAAVRMNRAVRDYDAVGRYGGEEFIVVLSNADLAAAKVVAERLRTAIAGVPFHTQAGLLNVSASLGVASARGSEADGEELVGRADAALYTAKAGGRDRVVLAEALRALAPVRRGDEIAAAADASSLRDSGSVAPRSVVSRFRPA